MKQSQKNNDNIYQSLNDQETVLNEVTRVYHKNFELLRENQEILHNQLYQLSKDFELIDSIECAFSFANIIDNLLIQLHSVQYLLNNIEIGITFASLNVLHSSIIKTTELQLIISKLEAIYGTQQIPVLENFVNYYYLLCTAQVLIKDRMVLFKIHIPLITTSYKYFQLYSIPISNMTIIPLEPYLLLNDLENWATSIRCPKIENFHYCLQNDLYRSQSCLATLINTGRNLCHGISIHLQNSSVEQINPNQILVIPTRPEKVKSYCNGQGLHEIHKPSIIYLENCKIDVLGKIFISRSPIQEEFIFNLQKKKKKSRKPLHLRNIEETKEQHLKSLINNLHVESQEAHHAWINSTLICIFIFIIIILLS